MRYFIFALIFVFCFSNFALAKEANWSSKIDKIEEKVLQSVKQTQEKIKEAVKKEIKAEIIRILNPLKDKIQQGSSLIKKGFYKIKDYLIELFKEQKRYLNEKVRE